ncbi:MAG: hypothetical protein RI950_665 [Bacteroidota bacterium]
MEANEQVLAYLNQNLNKKIADGNPAPIGIWLDGTLVKAEAGKLTAEFVVRPDFLNHAGVIHGGVISAMLDEMMGMTLITAKIDHLYVTINLYIDFLYGAKANEKITVTTEIQRVGKKIANIEAKLHNADGKLFKIAIGRRRRLISRPKPSYS